MGLICVKCFLYHLAHSKCFLSVGYSNYVLVLLEGNLKLFHMANMDIMLQIVAMHLTAVSPLDADYPLNAVS